LFSGALSRGPQGHQTPPISSEYQAQDPAKSRVTLDVPPEICGWMGYPFDEVFRITGLPDDSRMRMMRNKDG